MTYKIPIDWDAVTTVSFLQRQVIIHSIIYYEFNTNVISDKSYDEIGKNLVNWMNRCTTDELENTQYYYAMYDFDGSTGFDIRGRLTDKDKDYLIHMAWNIVNLHSNGEGY